MIGLTHKQAELLAFIHMSFDSGAGCPSFEEMKETTGQKSKSAIHRLISALEERGHIHRIPNRARALGLGPKPVRLLTNDELIQEARARGLLVVGRA